MGYNRRKDESVQAKNTKDKREITSTVGDGRGGNVTGSGKSYGLGDIKRDPQLSAVSEGLTQTVGVGFQDGFEAGAAGALGFSGGAPRRHE